MSRLEAMGISSFREMLMPFKDLSLGQQDCVKMAKTLGHGAVFDEFGSTLQYPVDSQPTSAEEDAEWELVREEADEECEWELVPKD